MRIKRQGALQAHNPVIQVKTSHGAEEAPHCESHLLKTMLTFLVLLPSAPISVAGHRQRPQRDARSSSRRSTSISSAQDASNWKPLSEVERTIQHDMATYNTLNPECGQRQCKSAHGRAIQWGCSAPCWHRLGSTAIMVVIVCRSDVHI